MQYFAEHKRCPLPGTINEAAEVVRKGILIYQGFQRTPLKKRGDLYEASCTKYGTL